MQGAVTPPCSKSYAQRALAASLLCHGISELHNVEFCSDTLSAIRCIEALGAVVEKTSPSSLRIRGGLHPVTDRLDVGESGLSTRLFTPIASLLSTPVVISGHGTLLHRPMDMMIAPLRCLGVDVRDGGGFLPIEVCGPLCGGEVTVDGSISSQFVTGLLLALPMARTDTVMHVEGAVSTPYIDMTIDTAERFGVRIHHNGYEEFFVEGQQEYVPTVMEIEGDWSASAMLLVAGATAGKLTVNNISMLSRQADVAICDALVEAGAELTSEERSITVSSRHLSAFEFDATNCPDLFPALAVLAACAEGVSVIRGTQRLEHKESNRAQTIAEQFGKLGIDVDISETNVMRIRGGSIHSAHVDGCGDHRIAMALAVAALNSDGEVVISGSECVAKSYPDFFEALDRLRER